jgi:hypothetical protein
LAPNPFYFTFGLKFAISILNCIDPLRKSSDGFFEGLIPVPAFFTPWMDCKMLMRRSSVQVPSQDPLNNSRASARPPFLFPPLLTVKGGIPNLFFSSDQEKGDELFNLFRNIYGRWDIRCGDNVSAICGEGGDLD